MKRHIGKIANTDQRCLVVFMQIPGREDHALIVSTDNLNPRFEQALMSVVESKEAQAAVDLGEVLQRRVMQDTNEYLLQALHERGMLRPVHVDQVVMMPVPNMPFPLRGVLRDMGRTIPGEAPIKDAVERFNPHANNSAALDSETKLNIAQNLLVEADMLMAEARNKRDKAFTFAPELRQTSPSFTTESGTLMTIGTAGDVTIATPGKLTMAEGSTTKASNRKAARKADKSAG